MEGKETRRERNRGKRSEQEKSEGERRREWREMGGVHTWCHCLLHRLWALLFFLCRFFFDRRS